MTASKDDPAHADALKKMADDIRVQNAAPDMLAACEAVSQWIRARQDEMPLTSASALATLDAAIKKARGTP